MAEGVRLEITGHEEALSKLGAAIARTDDRQGLFDAIGAALVVSTQDRFERETGPDGKKWPVSIRAKETGGKTLTDTARLVGSITHNATAEKLEVGTNVIYAAIHQLGGRIEAKGGGRLKFRLPDGSFRTVGSVTMPQRPFLGLDDEDEKEIEATAADWIMAPLGGPAGGPDVRP